MKTVITVNSLKELRTVSDFYGLEVKSSEIVVSFPYRLVTNFNSYPVEELTFEEFERRYLKNN